MPRPVQLVRPPPSLQPGMLSVPQGRPDDLASSLPCSRRPARPQVRVHAPGGRSASGTGPPPRILTWRFSFDQSRDAQSSTLTQYRGNSLTSQGKAERLRSPTLAFHPLDQRSFQRFPKPFPIFYDVPAQYVIFKIKSIPDSV